MSEGVFLLPRVSDTTGGNSCKQSANATAFGTAGLVVSAKAGRIYRVSIVNSAITRYFAQIHNKATAPINTEVPIWEENLPASGGCVMDFGLNGLYVSAGFSIAISSTKSVLTLAIATDCAAYSLYAATTA